MMITKALLKENLEEYFKELWPVLLFSGLYATAIYYLHVQRGLEFMASLGFLPIGFVITALSVFLTFRNNMAYNRWWEAHTLWNNLDAHSLSFLVQLRSFLNAEDPATQAICRRIVLRHLAFVNLLRLQLWEQPIQAETLPHLDPQDWARLKRTPNPAAQMLVLQGDDLAQLSAREVLAVLQVFALTNTLGLISNVLGNCQRIKKTPFPSAYGSLIFVLNMIFLLLFPLYLLSVFSDDISKLWMIPVTMLVVFVAGFANRVGQGLEEPFENNPKGVPLLQFCNTIERELLQAIETPEPVLYSKAI